MNSPENSDEELSNGAFDTRSLGNARIFFAWEGGERFLHHLSNSGIRLIVVEADVPLMEGIAILKVTRSLDALQAMARELARSFDGKIVSITGSSGKTTAKTWLSHILQDRFNLLSNAGSFNNHIGCPVTVLNLQPEHNLLILEMGSSGLGELDLLSSIAPADITLLLNVGHAHLGKFGSLDNTYKAKTEIFLNQRKKAVSLVPYSDRKLRGYLKAGNLEYFGKESPHFSWKTLEVDSDKREQKILFQSLYGNRIATIGQLGNYVGEVLSGIFAVCFHLGLSWEEIMVKLVDLPQEKGRSTFLKGPNDVLILDDTYNANPESLINMLRTICSLDKDRCIGVVGNMAELDDNLKESADYILLNLPEELSHLFLSGETGRILLPLIRDGNPDLDVIFIESVRELIEEVGDLSDGRTVIGIKGSRSAHMERVVYGLTGKATSCDLVSCGRLNMCSACDQF